MAQHKWVRSTLGHGETMCEFCKITNREAAVLGRLNECEHAPAVFDQAISDDHQEAINLLRKWCGLFFGRNGDMTHMDNEVYQKAHTRLFMETADWLKAKGHRP
jgi:hypothetical protein